MIVRIFKLVVNFKVFLLIGLLLYSFFVSKLDKQQEAFLEPHCTGVVTPYDEG